ncbi:MAG: hypothetical protein KGZ85_11040 [Ignavibacterium sp.]|nr:hypothetical protein [Ignavibacterium sp.]
MKIAVIGAGTFGSYIVDTISRKYKNCEITLYEVGSNKIKNEEEIGFRSNIISNNYNGLSKGRFFGFGGTSTKWGGQLLTFSDNDFSNPSPLLKEIIEINKKHQASIFSKFGIDYSYNEQIISQNLFVKTGVWLGYFNRNLFKYFRIKKLKNVKIVSNSRLIKIIKDESNRIQKIIIKKDEKEFEAEFDFYFLTAGAFESARLLIESKLVPLDRLNFSDHLSQKAFKIKGDTVINEIDFSFRIKGASLITKRIIGEIDNISFFANPIYNSEFPFFDNLKKLLFHRSLSTKLVFSVFKDLPSFIKFIWYLSVLRKLYVHKNEWYINIDIENYLNDNFINLSDIKDRYNELSLEVSFSVDKNIPLIFEKARKIIEKFLINNNVNYENCFSKIEIEKYEDTYHPFGLLCNFNSVYEYFNMFQNMLVVNTGILPRAGGINLTAAVFPLIEEYISEYMPLSS